MAFNKKIILPIMGLFILPPFLLACNNSNNDNGDSSGGDDIMTFEKAKEWIKNHQAKDSDKVDATSIKVTWDFTNPPSWNVTPTKSCFISLIKNYVGEYFDVQNYFTNHITNSMNDTYIGTPLTSEVIEYFTENDFATYCSKYDEFNVSDDGEQLIITRHSDDATNVVRDMKSVVLTFDSNSSPIKLEIKCDDTKIMYASVPISYTGTINVDLTFSSDPQILNKLAL